MKVIIITGGSDGLGKALACDLAGNNKVIVVSRNKVALERVAQSTGCEWRECDVTNPQQVDEVISGIAEQYGSVDVVINGAGVFHERELVETDYADIHQVISVNTLGALYVAKAALVHMKRQKNGLIINVISQSGIYTRPSRVVYSTSKWAMTGMTKALQQEVAEYGVRVTGLYPGLLETDFIKKAGGKPNGESIKVAEVVGAVNYILSCDDDTLIPELGIKHYKRTV